MRAKFFVVKRLAVPGTAGLRLCSQTVQAILPMDDELVLASDETISLRCDKRSEGAPGGRVEDLTPTG